MSFAIVVIINKAFKLFKLVLVFIVTPVAIGDIQRTQGTLKTVCKAKNRYRHLLLCLHLHPPLWLVGTGLKPERTGLIEL